MDLGRKVIKVLDSDGNVMGTSFLCHPDGFALTCWHVVDAAHWIEPEERGVNGPPTGTVICAENRYTAVLLRHLSAVESDIAVLKLIRLNSAGDQAWDYLDLDSYWRVELSDCVHSFGYPNEVYKGVYRKAGISINGQVGGLTPTTPDSGVFPQGESYHPQSLSFYPLVGLNVSNIDHGYSGAPVVHSDTKKVIGLVWAKAPDIQPPDKRLAGQAFFIRLAPLFESWTALKVQHDVFEKMRRWIGTQAQAKLDQKLHDAPFIPLNLEQGIIPEKNRARSHRKDCAEPHLQHGRTWKPVDPKQLYYLRGRYVLSASVGAGKTTLIYKLAADLVAHTDTVPIMLSCRELERINPNSWEALKLVLVDRFTREFLELDEADRFSPQSLKVDVQDFFDKAYRRIIFLFDGLDQINGASPAALVEQAFRDITLRRPVIITSRPSAVLPLESDTNVTFFRLQSFTPQDLKRYFGDRYQQARSLTILAPELATVPMLAYMIRELMVRADVAQVTTCTEIYAKFLRFILSTQDTNKPLYLERPTLARTFSQALKKLAFRALANNPPQIKMIQETFPHDAGIELEELTRFGLVNRVLEQGETGLLFTHQSYQEFLAAEYACDHPEEIERVLRERWNPKWREVIRFMAGLHGPGVIMRIQLEADNVIHSNLFLLARCLPEVKPLDSGMINQIRTELIALLRGPFRMLALEALGQLRNLVDRATLHAMAVLLEDPNNLVRSAAIEALTRHAGWIDTETVRAICARLADKQEDVRLTARKALSRLEEQVDVGTLYVLANRLGDGSSEESRAAGEVLGNLAEKVDAKTLRIIASMLERDDSHVSTRAGETLARMGERLDDETLFVIRTRLGHAKAWARTAAMCALIELKSVDAGTVKALVARLEDTDGWIRNAAGYVLAKLRDGVSVETITDIVARLENERASVRQAALEALAWLSQRVDTETVLKIVELLEDPDREVRIAAIGAVAAQGWQIEPRLVRAIAERLTDSEGNVSYAAEQALKRLGDRVNSETLRFIVSLLEDANPKVRRAALGTLAIHGERIESEAMCAIAACLDDVDSDTRGEAYRALQGLAEHVDAKTIEVIRAVLIRNKNSGRLLALRTLGSFDNQVDGNTLCIVAGFLKDRNPWTRAAVIEVLSKHGDWIKTETARAIVAQLWDEDSVLSGAALEALTGLAVDAKTMLLIVRRLKSKYAWVRQVAIDALESISYRVDARALRRIAKCLWDRDPGIRQKAILTLEKQGDRIDIETVRAIASRLSDDEDWVSATALAALTQLSKRLDYEMVCSIIVRLNHKEDWVRHGALTSLLHLYEAGVSLPSLTIPAAVKPHEL